MKKSSKSKTILEKIENIYDKVVEYITPKIPTILVFTLIFVLLYMHHSLLAMYFDDFGNGSVSYGRASPDIIGTNYTLSQLLDWASFIYNNWSGRLLYALMFFIPLIKNSIKLFMFIQCFVIIGIIYYIYKIIKSNTKYDSFLIPVVLFILYMLFDMTILRNGIYWGSASILYIWTLLPTFMFIYYFMEVTKKIKNKEKVRYYLWVPILCILAFFTVFSQEQIGIGIIIFLILYIIFEQGKKIKDYLKIDIPVGIVSIVSYIVLFAAPGNWARMDSNVKFAKMSFFEKIINRFPFLMKILFENKYYMIALAVVFFLALFVSAKKLKLDTKKLTVVSIIFGILSLIYLLVSNETYIVVYGFIWFIALGLLMLMYFVKTKRLSLIGIPIGGCCTYFCILVAPTNDYRTMLPLLFFLFLMIGFFFAEVVKEKKAICNIILLVLFVVFGSIGAINYNKVYKGYAENYGIEELNFKILKSYKGKNPSTITLYKYSSAWYGSTRLYQHDYKNWVCEYFDLPMDVEIVWVDPYEEIRLYD